MDPARKLLRSASTMQNDLRHQDNQTIDGRAGSSPREDRKQGRGSPVRKTLNAYGIDDNLQTLARLNQEKHKVFVKKDKSGAADLAHGAYVSKRGEDEYGAFKWLNPRGLKKYQTNDLAQVTLTRENLKQLQNTYKNEDATGFLVDLLRGNSRNPRDQTYIDVYKKNPDVFHYSSPLGSGNGFLIYPNIPYMSEAYTDERARSLAVKREGIQLTAWAVHPALPHDFIREINGGETAGGTSANQGAELNQRSAELKTGVKSLTSVLDLEQGDVAMLEKLKQDTLRHLADAYGAFADKNKVNLFFHFPVAPSTATLHLHVWVNKGDHPLNESRAFDVDDIIQHLKRGGNIESLILSRNNGKFILPAKDGLHKIKGMPESEAPTREDYKDLMLPIEADPEKPR